MDTLEKLRIIESDAVPKEGANIETLSTSIKTTYSCGCFFVEHFACSKPSMKKEDQPQKIYNEAYARRKYFIELCAEHREHS